MSRISILFLCILAFALARPIHVTGQDEQPKPAPPGSTEPAQLTAEALREIIREELDARLTKISTDSFLPKEGVCVDAPKSDSAAQSQSATEKQPTCTGPDCKTAIVPAKRVYSTWIKSHKKVTITKPTPYIALETVWDPISCCWRKKYVTKYRNEEHVIVVPYMKEVIQEAVGYQKIKVCLDDV